MPGGILDRPTQFGVWPQCWVPPACCRWRWFPYTTNTGVLVLQAKDLLSADHQVEAMQTLHDWPTNQCCCQISLTSWAVGIIAIWCRWLWASLRSGADAITVQLAVCNCCHTHLACNCVRGSLPLTGIHGVLQPTTSALVKWLSPSSSPTT